MGAIKLLKDSVINQIAAGEVVERPSSVVRELLDNAIDAGATEVTVKIVEAGKTLIQVIDNGSGMSREDAHMAFERHATSKLSSLQDLEDLATKGFRGEALPSIASVSRIRLVTRASDSEAGTELELAGGKVVQVQGVAAQKGSLIEVRNLFFNTPARKKFLKSDRVEELKIKELVQHLALCHPEIAFKLYTNDVQTLSIPQDTDAQTRAKKLFKGNTVQVKYQYDEVVVEGRLGHPSAASADARTLVLIVNNRVVSDKLLLRAVKEGFSSTLKDREFPVGFISLRVPGQFLDINVHPQKAEVRFSFPQKIFAAVKTAVQESISEFKSPSAPAWERPGSLSQTPSVFEDTPHFFTQTQFAPQGGLHFGSVPSEPSEANDFSGRYSDLVFKGQLFECYLLCEAHGNFYIVDMHAAHERLNFNRIKDAQDTNARTSQALLVPLTVTIGEAGVHRLLAQSDTLTGFGFDIEQFSEDTVIVRAVPTLLQNHDCNALMKELAALDEADTNPAAIQTRLDYVAARIACHASVRSGRILKSDEVYALFAAMDSAAFSAACPHGRPCVVQFSEREVERWFGRDR